MKALGIFKLLYVQVLVAIVLGVLVGILWPDLGKKLEPLSKGFINLVKMLIAPMIFCTVAGGIAHMTDKSSFGRVGAKALIYFEVVSTLALGIGVAVALIVRPGVGFPINKDAMSAADLAKVADYAEKAENLSTTQFLLNIIPDSFVGAFAKGDILPVLLLSILTGFACARLGDFGKQAAGALDAVAKVFFSLIHIVVKVAPIGAFGGMGYLVATHGVEALGSLAKLIGLFYLTSAIFIIVVLGVISRMAGFNLFRFLNYIKEEILIVLGASSSEAALPQLMQKLKRLGVSKPVVDLVIPTGYSFNPDGTSIYMTLAILFLAQATGNHLSAVQIIAILGVAMLSSKGASGVTGAGFIGLLATLHAVPGIPDYAVVAIFGIDRFMSECRALVNFIGNGVAGIVVARWEKAVDMDVLHRELKAGPIPRHDLTPAPDETGPD